MPGGLAQDGLFEPSELRRDPFGLKVPLGKVGLQEVHSNQGAGLALVVQPQAAGAVILTNDGTLDRMFGREGHEAVQVLRPYGDGHSFLGFRDPYLPLIEAFVLQGDSIQVDRLARRQVEEADSTARRRRCP